MSRRDTILIAVLINAGLLVILFATAITSDGGEPTLAQAPAMKQEVLVPQPVRTEVVSRFVIEDEVDQVIQQLEAPKPAPEVAESVAAAPALAPSSTEVVEVTVKRGDSLDRIARGNGSTIEAIMDASNLKSTRLQIGQVLKVPLVKKSGSVAAAEQPAAGDDQFYTIRSGDNPWAVAMKFRIPLSDLLKINNLDEESARRLKPGDRIRIQ